MKLTAVILVLLLGVAQIANAVPVPSCPAGDYAHATFTETTAGTTATGACDPAYSQLAAGPPTRVCTASGTWSSVVLNICNHDACIGVSEGYIVWPTINALQQAFGKCPAGMVATGGTPRRPCLAGGTWGAIVNPCSQVTCPSVPSYSNASWPMTNATLTATGSCLFGLSGAPQRNCLAGGVWSSTVTQPCGNYKCGQEVSGGETWPETNALGTASFSCGANYTGSITRTCDATGNWGTVDNTCVGFCPGYNDGVTVWQDTNEGQSASGACQTNYTGTPTRQCVSAGVWGSVSTPCEPYNCSADATSLIGNATWPLTVGNAVATGTCLPLFKGTPTRYCSGTGVWATTADTGCSPITCAGFTDGNATWPTTNAAATPTTVTGTCLPLYYGGETRTCNSTGGWGPISGVCAAPCPAADYAHATFTTTLPGVTAVGTCDPGYSQLAAGPPTRFCSNSGWSVSVLNVCNHETCPQVNEGFITWLSINALTSESIHCPANMVGSGGGVPTRSCLDGGVWGPISFPCVQVVCNTVASYSGASWPTTNATLTATGTCLSGSGSPQRVCQSGGVWSNTVTQPCS